MQLEWAFSVPLLFVYGLLTIGTTLQALRLHSAAPFTTQHLVYLLAASLFFFRTAFFVLFPVEWNEDSGLLRYREWHTVTRMGLYIADELPAILFFSIYTAVALFWADLYLCAIEHVRFYQNVVRPVTLATNMLAYTIVLALWLLYLTSWDTKDYYVNLAYAGFVAVLYFLTAICFLWFGQNAANEFRIVPIEVELRRRLLREVSVITIISTICMVLRAVVLVLIANKHVYLQNDIVLFFSYLYFICLEAFPTLTILYFYRRLPAAPQAYDSENAPFIPKSSSSKLWMDDAERAEASIERISGESHAI